MIDLTLETRLAHLESQLGAITRNHRHLRRVVLVGSLLLAAVAGGLIWQFLPYKVLRGRGAEIRDENGLTRIWLSAWGGMESGALISLVAYQGNERASLSYHDEGH